MNRLASQTTYNGINLLNGSAGVVNVQVGANVGQTISLDLSQGVSAASLGSGVPQAGNTLGTITGLDLNSNGTANSSGGTGAITQINVLSNGTGGFTYTDQNNQSLSTTAVSNLFSTTSSGGIQSLSLNGSTTGLAVSSQITAINDDFTTGGGSAASAGTVLGKISDLNIDPTTGSAASAGTPNAITSITVEADGNGGVQYVDQNGNSLSSAASTALFTSSSTGIAMTAGASSGGLTSTVGTTLSSINTNNAPTSVADVNVSTTAGANLAMETIDNALATISNIQATLGAAQNRLTGISTSQQAESTDLSSAQSQITDADFAQETANLSKAQVLQQAGISVLSQANSMPQQVLKLLQ